MKTILLGAALACVLGTPAFAGITCNLNDKKGHALTYSFTKGGDGYVNEIVVKRDGAVVSDGGPLWTRVSDKVQQSITLRQSGWSIAYPWDATKGTSVLRQRNAVIATGVCDADYAVDNSAPAPAPEPAPAATAPPITEAAPTYAPHAYDVLTSRADFMHFAGETVIMAQRQGKDLSPVECDNDGCSKDVAFQPGGTSADGEWVSVSYVWGNGPGKGPDHFVVLLCMGPPRTTRIELVGTATV
jgi:hypothetical protein